MISLHVGGAGVNIGKSCIKQYASEHGIEPDGYMLDETTSSDVDVNNYVHFRENSLGRWTPRSLFFDSDPSAIDRLL